MYYFVIGKLNDRETVLAGTGEFPEEFLDMKVSKAIFSSDINIYNKARLDFHTEMYARLVNERDDFINSLKDGSLEYGMQKINEYKDKIKNQRWFVETLVDRLNTADVDFDNELAIIIHDEAKAERIVNRGTI